MNAFDGNSLDEHAFALKLRNKLNQSCTTLDTAVTDRLFEARQKALASHAVRVSELSPAGVVGRQILNFGGEYARPVLAALALLAFVACGDYVTTIQHAADLEEVDSALLADDLPINAYLDRGFETWLNSSSAQH